MKYVEQGYNILVDWKKREVRFKREKEEFKMDFDLLFDKHKEKIEKEREK